MAMRCTLHPPRRCSAVPPCFSAMPFRPQPSLHACHCTTYPSHPKLSQNPVCQHPQSWRLSLARCLATHTPRTQTASCLACSTCHHPLHQSTKSIAQPPTCQLCSSRHAAIFGCYWVHHTGNIATGNSLPRIATHPTLTLHVAFWQVGPRHSNSRAARGLQNLRINDCQRLINLAPWPTKHAV